MSIMDKKFKRLQSQLNRSCEDLVSMQTKKFRRDKA
jgi:hypothetical protein